MPRVSSAFWLVYQARSIRGFLLYANYHRVNQRARARASSRGTALSSTAADFRMWGDVSAHRRAEPN